MKQALTHIILLALVLCPSESTAQNDACGASTVLACGAVVSGNSALYTADVAPFCGTGDGTAGGLWYRFIGTGNNVTASLCGSAYDTRIRVYTGGCAALTCVAGNDDFCGLQSQVTWASVLGTTYRILVHGFGAATGAYTLTITCAPPPVPMCYVQSSVTYAADPYTGTPLTLSDDIHSAAIPIGFSFCYNGTSYTQCVISSNNYVTFNLAVAGTYSPWPTVAVPNTLPVEVGNSILNPWQDIYPPGGGNIYYQTLGVMPNRRFVVSYSNVSMFSCTSLRYTSQTVLYEGSNCIGSYIFDKPICAGWNGGNAVHALHNAGGTSASIVPGRNNTQWTAASQGLMFMPTCAPCSTAVTAQCLVLVLPIELLHFRGWNQGASNIIEWSTASEQNSDHFTLERGDDVEHFTPIGRVDGAGNSNTMIAYVMKDPSPLQGTNYYRLRQVDVNGNEKLSDVISVDMSRSNDIIVYPNPAVHRTNYVLSDAIALPATLLFRDLAGRVVQSTEISEREGELEIGNLLAGIYFLELPAGCATSTARLIVE